jgi:hypothetical protein
MGMLGYKSTHRVFMEITQTGGEREILKINGKHLYVKVG